MGQRSQCLPRRRWNSQVRLGSDTAGTVPRDHRNPVPFRTEGTLAFRLDWQHLVYAFSLLNAVTFSPRFLIQGR